jgi:hypothetical protein
MPTGSKLDCRETYRIRSALGTRNTQAEEIPPYLFLGYQQGNRFQQRRRAERRVSLRPRWYEGTNY